MHKKTQGITPPKKKKKNQDSVGFWDMSSQDMCIRCPSSSRGRRKATAALAAVTQGKPPVSLDAAWSSPAAALFRCFRKRWRITSENMARCALRKIFLHGPWGQPHGKVKRRRGWRVGSLSVAIQIYCLGTALLSKTR